ncbi:MAG: DUF4293 domain-containing protein [Prolixibacteraceae bacterium]
MIQRIQTVYLLLALILLGLVAWLPLGEIAVGDQIYNFTINGIKADHTQELIYNGLPLMVMLSIIIVLQLLIVFGFKNRIRQMRLATFNMILMAGIVGIAFYFLKASVKELGEAMSINYKLALAFPIVAIILNYLAIRAIGKDEALVRSIDRIR